MSDNQNSKVSFQSLIDESDELLTRLYYINMKICDICIQSIDALEKQGKKSGAGRELIQSYYHRQSPVVEAVIELLGVEPDFQDCHSKYAKN